jgi:2-methylcitrate dehydratase PrpD
VDGQVSASQFLPESLHRSEVGALLPKIDTRIDDECERLYPRTRSGVVRVTLRTGEKAERRVVEPKGEATSPLTDADLERKFTTNCEPLIGRARCDELLHFIWHFEQENLPRFLKLLACS